MTTQQKLFSRYLPSMQPGKLIWIGARPERREPMIVLQEGEAIETLGLKGDRRCNASPHSARQITLISAEHIKVLCNILNKDEIDPSLLRRNLVTAGINLLALRHQKFQIGNAIFEGTAHCHPCSRMEKALGTGATAAMIGHGGICAKIIKSGTFKLDDLVIPIIEP